MSRILNRIKSHIKSRLNSLLNSSPPAPVIPHQRLSKESAISSLLKCSVPISDVVDVGVNTGTFELIKTLGDRKHHLFEPSPEYRTEIERNYSAVNYSLYPIALSNASRTAWLISTSLLKDGKITHTTISDTTVECDGNSIVDCQPIQIQTLDDLGSHFPNHFLLKVDVDGEDTNVLKGGTNCLKKASVVIVEATYANLIERGTLLENAGFGLTHIVDQAYYGEGLYQVDLVYVRKDLITERLRPDIDDFNPSDWRFV